MGERVMGERVSIRVTWREIPTIKDGATAPFTVSRTLTAGQIAMLPPPVSVRQAQIELSEHKVGVVFDGRALDTKLTLDDLLTLQNGAAPKLLCLDLLPADVVAERFGGNKIVPLKPSYSPSVKTRHMTSVQLVEFLKNNNHEAPDGLSTPRKLLRELAEELEREADR
jgi:hypothetical protein